jgi:tRNA-binding EMAP/Myf-like protein
LKIEVVSGPCIVFANLKARPLGGVPSNGMVMCVKNEEGNLEILRPHKDAKIGERVILEGIEMS